MLNATNDIFFGWLAIPERKLEIIFILYTPTSSHLAVLQLYQMNYFVHSSYKLQVDLGGLFNSSRLSTLTRIEGDAILPSTPACRKTDLSPGSPSGITRFISFENMVFHFPMILRIKKGHSFADGQNLIHSMCVKQTLKSSFLGTIFSPHSCFHSVILLLFFPPSKCIPLILNFLSIKSC